MTIEILKSQDSRNRKSIAVMNSKFFLYQSLRWTLCSPFWKSPTRDVTSYWQADWTTDFLEDTIPPPPHLTYDEFHVPDVLIVLLYMWRLNSQGYWIKQEQSYELSMGDSRNYTRQLYKHIHVVQHICSTFIAAVAAYLINLTRLRQHCSSSWLLVFTRRFWLLCHLHMEHR